MCWSLLNDIIIIMIIIIIIIDTNIRHSNSSVL